MSLGVRFRRLLSLCEEVGGERVEVELKRPGCATWEWREDAGRATTRGLLTGIEEGD
jgi:hypothetical protein